jgi:putative phage-type endonuclease
MEHGMSDEAWHEWRRNGIGGSDVAGLLMPGKWSSPWSIWAAKTGLIEPTESTDRQRIGKRMESVIAAEFEDARPGLYVLGEQTWCEHPQHSWARCTVDGFVAERVDAEIEFTGDTALGVFEAKTDSRFGWDEVPANYRMQCLWNMGVTGMRSAFLAVMFAGFRFEVFEVEWDQAEWDLMLDVAGTFWHEHVLTGVPPLADGSEATADALARAYPEHVPGVEVALDDIAGSLEQRDYLRDQRKEYDDALKEIDNAIKARLADAEVGTVAGVPVLTYRASERKGYWVEPTTVRTLRAAPKPKAKA